MNVADRSWIVDVLKRTLYARVCNNCAWYCEHDGLTTNAIESMGLDYTAPEFKNAEGPDVFWCSREDLIRLLTERHGQEDMLALLLEMETT